MYAIIGIIVLLVMVFGGFMLSGGALGPVMAAMPYEMLIIGGAAAGALVAGNSLDGLKALGTAMGKIFKGPKHDKQDHVDAIALTTQLMRMLKNDGPVALESHLEDPANSTVFSAYPNLLKNEALIALICDTLTLLVVSSGTLETHAVEEVMDNAMKTHFHEMHEPQHNLQTLSDALPALGIVAAVLGVVKTMGSIDKPPEILGKMIGAALVGTFLGVLLAYGLVGPIASNLKMYADADSKYYHCIKAGLLAHMQGYAPAVSVEFARKILMAHERTSFTELEEALEDAPSA